MMFKCTPKCRKHSYHMLAIKLPYYNYVFKEILSCCFTTNVPKTDYSQKSSMRLQPTIWRSIYKPQVYNLKNMEKKEHAFVDEAEIKNLRYIC